jgi:DeoR family fructose operon transcriptional repressor
MEVSGMKANDAALLSAPDRRERILQLLRERSRLAVPELCERFNVSPATIRGDLRDLDRDGRLRRTHGGATPLGKAGFERDSSGKQIERIEEKRRIALKAAEFVEDGDTIALDTGTTVFEMARFVAGRKNLSVVTNDVEIATFLENNSHANIILIGGMLRRGFHCATGPMTVAAISSLNVDKAFMASNAFSLDKGFTTPNFEHAEVKRAMLSIAAEATMLVDSGKIGRVSFIKFADTGDVDRFVTDDRIGAETRRSLEEENGGLELFVV